MKYTITMLIDGVNVVTNFYAPNAQACFDLRETLLLYRLAVENSGIVSAVCG